MTTRRAFIGALTGGLLTAPITVHAQPAGKVYRVGYLTAGSLTANPRVLEAFRQGLRELGCGLTIPPSLLARADEVIR